MKNQSPHMEGNRRKVVCFGPGPKFKGGISNYNTSLARTLAQFEDVEVEVVSWTQQYPAIVPRAFIDKKSRKDFLSEHAIPVSYLTNYNQPWTWKTTAKKIAALEPDIVVMQWYNAVQGIPLQSIARYLKKKSKAEIIFDLHFVKPKENSRLDDALTRLGLKHADAYIVHALKTYEELKQLYKRTSFLLTEDGKRAPKGQKTVLKLFHPIYDLFQPDPAFDVDAFKRKHMLKQHVFLFFGFIRKYKGLHHAIQAFDVVRKQRDDVSLLICGESFWQTLNQNQLSTRIKNAFFSVAKTLFLNKDDDERNYRPLDLLKTLNLEKDTLLVNEFVSNEEVHKYFQVSDSVLLFYLTATPSGVESLSYNFELPILATDVGHFPETIQDGFNGYLAKANDVNDMAKIMIKSIENPIDRKNIAKATERMSWENYAKAILNARKNTA